MRIDPTTQGKEVTFALNSNLAKADIRGNGKMELTGDYPVTRMTFNNVTYSGLSR